MRIVIPFVVGLAVGSAITWFVAYVHPASQARRHAIEYVNRVEPEFSDAAIYALSTIPLIESGDTNAAIERLSHPIADYYRLYASNPGTNQYRAKMRETIDTMAHSNAVVAASIQREISRQHE
jgi:hypothetical protein